MGDLQVNETFQDRILIKKDSDGTAGTGLTVSCVITDELGNRSAGTVAEMTNGWYKLTDFTPDASGTWSTEWSIFEVGYTAHYPYKEFKVGGGEVTDIKTDTADIANVHTHAAGAETQATAAAADAVLLKADVGDASASTLTSIYGILGNPATTISSRLDTVVADTPYIADAALPVAPTASSLASRLRAISVLETTISADGRSTTGCRLAAGDTHNNAYVNMIVVLDNNEGNLNYVSRTITAYTGATRQLTFTPAIEHDAVDAGRIWICANDTKINVTCDAIKARTDNRLQSVTFFSPPVTEVVADTSHTDAALPTVTIPNWTGTIVHVYAGFVCRMIENTNAAVNKLSGAQEIQINKAGGAWTDAINFVDDMFGMAASTREGGTVILGTIDLVGTIDVFNTTAQFQWDEPLTDQDALHFNDVQTFLIISYY